MISFLMRERSYLSVSKEEKDLIHVEVSCMFLTNKNTLVASLIYNPLSAIIDKIYTLAQWFSAGSHMGP